MNFCQLLFLLILFVACSERLEIICECSVGHCTRDTHPYGGAR